MTEMPASERNGNLRVRPDSRTKGVEPEAQLLRELRVLQVELELQNGERRRIQAEMEAAHARYCELYDLVPVGYFTFCDRGLIIEANLAAANLLGVAREALVEQQISNLIFPEDRDVFRRHRKSLFESSTPQLFELRLLGKGGVPFWAQLKTTSTQDAHGRTVGRAVVSSIAERKRLEEEGRQRTEELETANASLKRNGTQLRDLAVELTLAEERERKRLAAVLHDHLQQLIVAAQMKIGLLKRRLPDEDQDRVILEARDILSEAAKASQSLAADLHPPVLLQGGLMAGLHWLVRRMMTEHGLEVEVTGEDAPDIPEHISILLFQAVRELLLNVVKHAGVDHALVDLEQPDEGSIRVQVVDRGSGFSPEAVIDGFGLFHLHERICHIGGTVDVTTSPGNGTRFCMTVAFDPQPRFSSASSSPGVTHTHQNGTGP